MRRTFAAPLSTKHPGAAAQLVKAVLLQPEAALYVQDLKIDGCRGQWGWVDNYHEEIPEHTEYPEADMRLFEKQVQETRYVPNDNKHAWVAEIKAGVEDGLIALALTLLPNLASIDFQDSIEMYMRVAEVARRIAQEPSGSSPLSNLTHVNVGMPPSACSDEHAEAEAIEMFAGLPSVRVINGNKVGGNDEYLESLMLITSSNVTDLNFSKSDIPPQRLMLLLSGFSCLQSFTYWPSIDLDRAYGFEPLLIVNALMAYARNTLRELRLRAGSALKTYMGSLRHFSVLEYLDTDMVLLLGSPAETVQDIAPSCPRSLRHIKLFADSLVSR
ncbi:hypothetical protein MMC28_008373 [Mycoblastus sanguinarius]|nr:hypothetical protein [Mycoblastus sanguinarius]